MTNRAGMDVVTMQGIVAQLNRLADQIASFTGDVDRTARQLHGAWHGGDAAEFYALWNGRLKGGMTTVHNAVQTLAEAASSNLGEQVTASSVTDGMGGVSVGALPIDSVGATLGALDPWAANLDLLSMGVSGAAIAARYGKSLGAIGVVLKTGGPLLHALDGPLGVVNSGVNLGVHASDLIHDLQTNGVSNKTYNDELNMSFDVAAGAALFIPPPAGEVASLAIGLEGLGVGQLEKFDPAITADAFKLSPIGAAQQAITVVASGDFNPVDVASKVAGVEWNTAVDFSTRVADHAVDAVAAVGRGADHVVSNVAGVMSGGINRLEHLL